MRSDFTVAKMLQSLRQKRHWIACILSAVAGFLIFDFVPGYFNQNSTVLVLDMKVSSGTRLEVYVNHDFNEPLSGKLVPGQRKQYRLKGLVDDIRSLRIDPGESPGAGIDFFGIWAEDKNGTFAHIPAAAIANWASANVTHRGVIGDAARFVASTNDPMLFAEPNIKLRNESPALIARIVNMLAWPRSATFVVIVLGFLVLLSAAALNPARVAHPIIATVCVGLSVLSIYGFGTLYHPLAPIDTVVGRAGFHGLSTAPASLGVLCAVILSVLAAIGFAYLHKAQATQTKEPGAERPADREAIWKTANQLAVLVVVLACILFFFPQFDENLQHWLTYRTAPNWDGNNVLIWNYMSHTGGLPFRDFWYPYSGQYTFSKPAPFGMFMGGAYQAGAFSLAFYAVYRVTGRNIVTAAFAVIALIVGGTLAVYWGNVRYLQALSIGLIYLAINRDAERLQPAHYWFWFACCFSLYFEPAQVIYAAPAVLAKIVLDVFLDRPVDGGSLVRRLARDFTVPALFLVGHLGFVAANDQISNFADFYFGLGDQSASGAQPANLALDVTRPFTVQFLIVVTPMAMIGIGLYDRLRAGRGSSLAGDSLVVLGLVGVMILQKHLIRPIDWQVFVVPALGLFVYAAAKRGRTVIETAAAGGVLGAYVAVVLMSGALPGHWQKLVGGPERVWNYLLDDSLPFDEANAMRFAPAHFARFKDEIAVADRIRSLSPSEKPARTFMLTDNQVIYILLGHKPPYHSNIYNSSPLYEQRKVLAWLKDYKPQFAVLDPKKLMFDTFQVMIRTPLTFNHVIEHYVPLETIGVLELMRRRKPDEPVAAAFWRDKLGSSIAFGHFPRASTADRLSQCTHDAVCQNFLKISIPDSRHDRQKLTIPFKASGLDFAATFIAVSGSSPYFLSLDRVWFWDVLNRNGSAAQIGTEKLPTGVKVEIVRLAAGTDILY